MCVCVSESGLSSLEHALCFRFVCRNSAGELEIVSKVTKFVAVTYPIFVIGFVVFVWWLLKRILRCFGVGGTRGKEKDA